MPPLLPPSLPPSLRYLFLSLSNYDLVWHHSKGGKKRNMLGWVHPWRYCLESKSQKEEEKKKRETRHQVAKSYSWWSHTRHQFETDNNWNTNGKHTALLSHCSTAVYAGVWVCVKSATIGYCWKLKVHYRLIRRFLVFIFVKGQKRSCGHTHIEIVCVLSPLAVSCGKYTAGSS